MSSHDFDWNLSSEDEDFVEFLSKHNQQQKQQQQRQSAWSSSSFAAAVTPPSLPGAASASVDTEFSEEEDDEVDIDWEDAEFTPEEQADSDKKPAAVVAAAAVESDTRTLRAVEIDLNNPDSDSHSHSNSNNKQQQRKRQKRNKFRIESLPQSLQKLLWNLHQTHLLALSSRAMNLSKLSSNEQVLAVAHSLLPPQYVYSCSSFVKDQQQPFHCPTLSELSQFLDWYLDWVHNVQARRRARLQANQAAGAPRRQLQKSTPQPATAAPTTSAVDAQVSLLQFASYLSVTNDENPQLTPQSPPDQDHPSYQDHLACLLIAMARSMRWRARYVQSMDPMSPDLDVDHPFMENLKGSLFSSAAVAGNPSTASSASNGNSNSNTTYRSVTSHPVMGWLEILVTVKEDTISSNRNRNKNGTQRKHIRHHHRWVHVDPVNRLLDAPEQVEFLLAQQQQQQQQPSATSNSSSKKRQRTSFYPHKTNNNNANNTKKRAVVAYVVGVEHCPIMLQHTHDDENNDDDDAATTTTRIRWTDVTPRYAHSWIASLRRRGIGRSINNIRKNQLFNMEEAVRQSWWSQSLRSINKDCDSMVRRNSSNNHAPAAVAAASSPPAPPCKGNCAQDAIALDSSSSSNGEDDKTPPSKLSVSKNQPQQKQKQQQQQQQQPEHDDVDNFFDAVASMECEQLNAAARQNEAIPTSSKAFQTHPLYVIPSALGKAEVLVPDATKRVCGVFKGQLIYRREDVSTALTAIKWLYQGRRVRPEELARPIKKVTARKKPTPKTFRALRSYGVGTANQEISTLETDNDDDGLDKLYGHWQTDAWSPAPVGPTDALPVNEYNNIELQLLPPGLVHIDQPGLAATAKKLGLPYAPCLVGFEGHGGNRTPTIRGIVVHAHNESLMREAGAQMHHHAVEKQYHDRRQAVLLRWKRLMVGLLTKERLDRQYGDHSQQEEEAAPAAPAAPAEKEEGDD